jgi:DNA polymerase-3 subunit gamma/tau
MMAAEMAIIRLTHVADLPTPEELLRKLQGATPAPSGTSAAPTGNNAPQAGPTASAISAAPNRQATASRTGPATAQARAPETQAQTTLSHFPSFTHVVDLIRANRDVKLLVEVESCLRLKHYQPGRIEFSPTDNAPRDLAQRLGQQLQSWTGNRWAVSVVGDSTAKTIAEVRDAEEIDLREKALQHPMVQAVLTRFPKAEITRIRTRAEIAAEATEDALPEVEDEWDPFEDG